MEAAVELLPEISVVCLKEDHTGEDSVSATASYVPIDPCQPVIMGIRVAMGEGIARAYVDREVQVYEPDPVIPVGGVDQPVLDHEPSLAHAARTNDAH